MLPAAGSLDLRHTLGPLQHGRGDPTTRVTAAEVWRATRTPDGPGTLRLWWEGDRRAAWGPGADWLLDRVPALVGAGDAPFDLPVPDEVVARALAAAPGLRIGRCDTLLHQIVPTVLAQRVTSIEAARAWWLLCRRLSVPAPGPAGLLLPPDPDVLAQQPSWWFHPLGVERKRAETVIRCARRARGLERLVALDPVEAGARLGTIPGVGPWTVQSVLGPVLGDPTRCRSATSTSPTRSAGRWRARRAAPTSACWSCWRRTRASAAASSGPSSWRAGRRPSEGPRQRIQPIARW